MDEDTRRYVVIGGGLAGLAAAVWLVKRARGGGGGGGGGERHLARATWPARWTHPCDAGRGGGRCPRQRPARDRQRLPAPLPLPGQRRHPAAHRSFRSPRHSRGPDGRKVTMQTTGAGAVRTLFGLHPDASWAAPAARRPRHIAVGLAGLCISRQTLADLTTQQWFERVGMPAPAREALVGLARPGNRRRAGRPRIGQDLRQRDGARASGSGSSTVRRSPSAIPPSISTPSTSPAH